MQIKYLIVAKRSVLLRLKLLTESIKDKSTMIKLVQRMIQLSSESAQFELSEVFYLV